MVMPGDKGQMEIELITPIAMDEGLRFAIREGGRTVGAGVVTKILEQTNARSDYAQLRFVQTQELHDKQEKEDDDRQAVAQEILPCVPKPYPPQRGQGLGEGQ